MTRLILTLPDTWTPGLVTAQMARYAALSAQFTAAVNARDGKRQLDLEDQLRDIADEIIEAAVMSGGWHVDTEAQS